MVVAFYIARFTSKLQAALKNSPDFVVQYQVSSEELQTALRKGSLFYRYPESYLPANVIVRPRFGFLILHPVMCLQQKRRRQQTGRHTVSSVIRTIQLGKIFIAKKPPPLGSQKTVEG